MYFIVNYYKIIEGFLFDIFYVIGSNMIFKIYWDVGEKVVVSCLGIFDNVRLLVLKRVFCLFKVNDLFIVLFKSVIYNWRF